MTDKMTLQDEFEALAARCKAAQAQLDQADQDLKSLVSDLVDADSKGRPAIVLLRGELANLRDTLADELAELIRRRDIAYLAPFELAITQAESELTRRMETSKTSKKTMDEAFNVNLRFMNRGIRGQATEESDRQRVEIETTLARTKAQSGIDGDYLEKARNMLARAKADLETAKNQLAIQSIRRINEAMTR